MTVALKGVKVVEVGGAYAMPIVGMLMGSWGAEVIHVETPGTGDLQRRMVSNLGSWAVESDINYVWEHADRNKKGICVNLASPEGRTIIQRLCTEADVFLNNLRPYEMDKFDLSYKKLSTLNRRLIYANLTGYGLRGPEKNAGGFDSVAFWARSGVMELMHEPDSAPNMSRPAYGDSITSLSLLAGVMTALFMRAQTGMGQQVEVSLYNTAAWVLGSDISGCLATGHDALRPHRSEIGNPIRNVYPTKDRRWIMLGMTNAQHYWPEFCKVVDRPGWENDPRYATHAARKENAALLVKQIEDIFILKTYAEWIELLSRNKLVWSPVCTPLEVTRDAQAIANDFFADMDHDRYGTIRVMNNPIKLSGSPAGIRCRAPELGEHTDEIMSALGYPAAEIKRMKETGIIG